MSTPLSDSRSGCKPRSLSGIRRSIDRRREPIERLNRELEDLLQQESQASRLLDLPRELRDLVYEYAVAHSGKVFPAPEKYHDERVTDADNYKQPQGQLVAVNKQIRAEAAETMFA
ncbi:hypothetical protein AC579_5816 [Pseudocercospora musae]|uniref:Uncharacterized protein n=1 Tax=Pseudocercospora musae TaxID=113226 RepID=A0A139IR53_9PEZI|nr:hypothetical protein AC579_5816 [Pseudocercospora musae]